MARWLRWLPLVLFLGGCPKETADPPGRERVRVLIHESYRNQIREMFESSEDFEFDYEDLEWEDVPSYSGRDAVFAPSLAARFAHSDPDADVLFIDLYRLGSFRPAWLTRFDQGAFARVTESFREAFLAAARLDGKAPYAIPWSAKGNFLFYRKDLVSEPPKTWQELRETCDSLPDRVLPRRLRYCLLVTWDSIENDLYPLLWSLAQPGAEVQLDSPAVVDLLIDLAGMLGDEIASGFLMMPPAHQIAAVGEGIHKRYAEGEAVFMINWNNRYRFMVDDLRSKGRELPPTGIAPIPPAREASPAWSNIGTWGWIVPREPQDAPEQSRERHRRAMAFVREVSSAPAVRFFVERYGVLPARRDVPLPSDLSEVLSPVIVGALEGRDTAARFRFRDRGSDAFVHGFVRDAIRDVLMCRTSVTKPLPTGLIGDCARYFEECVQSEAASVDCLTQAVRRRLQSAERSIQQVRAADLRGQTERRRAR